MVDAWYAGANAASANRLITRNAISLVFSLPVSYEARIRGVEGVTAVARSNWFGGVYQDPKKFFAQFAVSDNYLESTRSSCCPRRSARRGCATARDAWSGGSLPTSTDSKWATFCLCAARSFPEPGSSWCAASSTAATRRRSRHMLLSLGLPERVAAQVAPQRADQVGVYIVGIDDRRDAAATVAPRSTRRSVTRAETLTESEQAFQLGFIAMSNEIIASIRSFPMS